MLRSMNLMGVSAKAFLSALALAGALVRLTITICHKQGWVAAPRPDRWHKGAPSLFGGVPIWITYVSLGLAFVPTSSHLAWKVIGASTLMFLVGLADDVWCLRPRAKLFFQFSVAALVVSSGIVYPLQNNPVKVVISLLWIVGITNAFNLLDNMDGLAAGIGLIAALYLGILYAGNGSREHALLLALLAGAAAGFLIFNFNPARIFMGDSGSLFLGFVLGTASLLGVSQSAGASALVLAPVLVLAIPILDTVFVSVTRRLRGQAVSQGGTDHSSHRLVRLGLQEQHAVLLLYVVSLASGAVALAGRRLPNSQALGLGALWFFCLLLLGSHLFRPETLADANHAPIASTSLGKMLTRDAPAFLLDPIRLSRPGKQRDETVKCLSSVVEPTHPPD